MNSSDRIQPAPRATEPRGDIFIDRGLAVPDVYPGDRLRVHARDPHTVFVYWESQDPGEHGWRLVLQDEQGRAMASFDTPPGHHRSGYVQVDDIGRVADALLLRREADGGLRAVARLAVGLRVRVPAAGDAHEHWVDVRTGAVGSGSPGEGRVETLGFAAAADVRSSASIVARGPRTATGAALDDDANDDDRTPWHRRKRGLPEPTND